MNKNMTINNELSLVKLKRRVARLFEFYDLNAPCLIKENELNLIRESCDELLFLINQTRNKLS